MAAALRLVVDHGDAPPPAHADHTASIAFAWGAIEWLVTWPILTPWLAVVRLTARR